MVLMQSRSSDGSTLLMSSSDGFCSALSFAPGELGSIYEGPAHPRSHRPTAIDVTSSNSEFTAPVAMAASTNSSSKLAPSSRFAPSPSPLTSQRPLSPTRSNSASSIATESSFARPPTVVSNPTPSVSTLPSVAAAGSHFPPSPTPPLTPLHNSASQTPSTSMSFAASVAGAASVVPSKRENEQDAKLGYAAAEHGSDPKKRRIAPTLVSGSAEGQADPGASK